MQAFKTAPFPPYPLLAGITLADGKALLGGKSGDAPDAIVLWLRQGGRCFYCDHPMIQIKGPGPHPPHAMTVDHIVTRTSKRGRAGPKVAACRRCNGRRGNKPAHEFIEYFR